MYLECKRPCYTVALFVSRFGRSYFFGHFADKFAARFDLIA